MESPIDVFLTEEQMFALGAQLGESHSRLSPLTPTTDRRRAASTARVLNTELVTAEGKLRPDLVPAFQTLANASAFSSVGYLSRSLVLEVAAYYPDPTSGLPAVSLSNTGEGFQLQSPPISTGILEILRQHIGDSLLRDIELEIDLPILEIWLFFGVIDAARRAVFDRILGRGGESPRHLTLQEIYDGLEMVDNEMQWLAPYFDDCLSLAKPSMREVESGIGRLAEGGWVSISDQNVVLTDMMEKLVDEFLLLNGHLRIRAAALDSRGEAASSDVRVIQGRSRLNLAWSHDQGSIDLLTLSSAQTLLLLSSMVEDPASILDEGSLSSSAGVAPAPPESVH
jgi:hypothetical protein